MNIVNQPQPWPHLEITDFLDQETFRQVFEYAQSHKINNSDRVHKFIDTDRHLSFVPAVTKTFSELLDSVGIVYSPDKIKVEFSACGPNYRYGIHSDGTYKVFTFVLNISEKGTGTRVYRENDPSTFVKECEWVQNGGIGFIRTDRSWHSYRNEMNIPRYTMNLILYK